MLETETDIAFDWQPSEEDAAKIAENEQRELKESKVELEHFNTFVNSPCFKAGLSEIHKQRRDLLEVITTVQAGNVNDIIDLLGNLGEYRGLVKFEKSIADHMQQLEEKINDQTTDLTK